ncbi:MAG TPA: ATP-binding protein [Polyangia bacterium]|nr:ATP-binding protein [Polyangia bacterium]
MAARSLERNDRDLPFALFYVLDHAQATARLAACNGLALDPRARPEAPALGDTEGWPLARALEARRPSCVSDVQARFPGLASDPHPDPIRSAYLLPIGAGADGPAAVVIAGVNPRLPLDDGYVSFFELLAATLGNAASNAMAGELARRREAALAEVDRAKMAFFANVSNEFRTPLTLMLGPIEDELGETDQPLPPGRHARLEAAHRNSLRLLRMVNTLLDFSHIEAGRMQAAFEPVDLVALTEDLAASFRAPIEKAGLRLSTRLEPLPEPILVDRELWAKILLNLLSNALKHTFRGGITVSLFVSDESSEFVELRVDDTGIGIPEKELPRLFQRFHRVKGARSRSDEGTGVGLALVRALAALHGGSVGVVSRAGLGSSFRVRLRRGADHLPREQIIAPRRSANDPAHVGAYVDEALQWSKEGDGASEGRNLDVREAHDGSAVAAGSRASVLLADNNTDMRNYLARLLGRTYDVTALGDGNAALQEAIVNPPDIIVLDVGLPGRDGFEVLGSLRSSEATRSIPLILLSARAGEDAALEGIDAGADDYIIKPFSGKAFLARVRSSIALAKMRKEAADKLAEANKELEAFSYSVSHDLRAPLRAIDGFSRALQTDFGDRLDDEGRRYIDRIRAGTQRMSELIEDLLSLSRITRAALTRGPVDLTAISRKVLADLAARDAGRAVEVNVADGLSGQADARLVTVLFENLLGNAWKFTSKQPSARIDVTSEQREGETVYIVRDNGAGFSMEYAHKLFAPFQRLHSNAEFPGTGIGLATVQRIVGRHGGRIWVEAAPGEGAKFFFTLAEQP